MATLVKSIQQSMEFQKVFIPALVQNVSIAKMKKVKKKVSNVGQIAFPVYTINPEYILGHSEKVLKI